MCWKTIVEVAKTLPDHATITQAETTAAVEVARAICCLVQSGCTRSDLDGNLMEDWDENGKGNRNRMKDHTEGMHKSKLDDGNHDIAADMSNSIALSIPADIPTSISVSLSARHSKLGARPKWRAQAAPSQPCASCGDTVVPPWRDKSLWRVTKPSYESTKIMEEFCETMTEKHAMEYTKLMKEFEEVKDTDPQSENEIEEETEGKDQAWKIKIEEIPYFMKEMSKGQKGKEDDRAKDKMVQEIAQDLDSSGRRLPDLLSFRTRVGSTLDTCLSVHARLHIFNACSVSSGRLKSLLDNSLHGPSSLQSLVGCLCRLRSTGNYVA